MAGLTAFAIWQSIPDTEKSRFIGFVTGVVAPSQSAPDLQVKPFSVADANDEEIAWLRTKVERKLVEFFSDAGLRVSHQLSPIGSDVKLDRVLIGSIGRKQDRLAIEVSLHRDGIFVASAHLEGAFPVLERVYPQFAKALAYAMDIDSATLMPLESKARPARTALSYALYLEARKSASGEDYDDAHALLDLAIESEPRFAMAFWAKAELFRLSGDTRREAELKAAAKRIDKDHPRFPIYQNVENPMPALLAKALESPWVQVAEGFGTWQLELPQYELTLNAWDFDPARYEIAVANQLNENGSTAPEFREHAKALLAINGGYFEIDAEDRLWPSGFLVVNGQETHTYVESAGSGILYQKDGAVGIDWSRNHSSHRNSTSAVQSGPFVVDPGGKNGIYSNDYDRRKRSAICLAGGRVVLVAVTGGGLSLFELGELLSKPRAQGGFGCERALNLDGGASAQVSFAFGDLALEIEGTWKIQNAVVVKPR